MSRRKIPPATITARPPARSDSAPKPITMPLETPEVDAPWLDEDYDHSDAVVVWSVIGVAVVIIVVIALWYLTRT